MIPPLFKHQQELLDTTCNAAAWGIFFETGAGKSAPTIHTTARLFTEKKIDSVIVIAPNGVHRNWISDEIPLHCGIPWSGMDWHSSRAKAQDRALAQLCESKKLIWFAITYDALITPRGRQAVLDVVKNRRFMLVIDEGSRVKNPTAQRTKKVAALRQIASYVRLLNGTPVETPLDLYSQMKILDDKFWIKHGIGSWTAFQSRFAVTKKITIGGDNDQHEIETHDVDGDAYEQLGLAGIVGSVEAPKKTTGRTIDVVVGYRDLDKLHTMIQPLSTRLTKEQAGLNLPPKLYQKLVFDLAPEQRRAYDKLRDEYMLELDNGALMTATLAMVRILRLQQIAGGYLPNPDDPEGEPILIPGAKNPRLDQFLDWTQDLGKAPVIVWCRFTHDVDIICRALGPAKCVRYDGKVGEKEKAKALELFRGGQRQFIIAKATSMGMGLTLVNSSLAFFYSNSFSMLDRLQAEDRQHRPGAHKAVTYIDLVAASTVDEKILKALKEKKGIADKVVGDAFRDWIT